MTNCDWGRPCHCADCRRPSRIEDECIYCVGNLAKPEGATSKHCNFCGENIHLTAHIPDSKKVTESINNLNGKQKAINKMFKV